MDQALTVLTIQSPTLVQETSLVTAFLAILIGIQKKDSR